MKGFKKVQFRKHEGQVILLRELMNGAKSSSDLSKFFKRSPHTVRYHLRNFEKLGLITKHRILGRKIIWEITEKK